MKFIAVDRLPAHLGCAVGWIGGAAIGAGATLACYEPSYSNGAVIAIGGVCMVLNAQIMWASQETTAQTAYAQGAASVDPTHVVSVAPPVVGNARVAAEMLPPASARLRPGK